MGSADKPEQGATGALPPAPKVIEIRKLDKIETTAYSNPNGA